MTPEQRELRDAVRHFLTQACPPPREPAGPALWRRFAAELGTAGLAVPEEYGGAGCGLAEVAIVCEELGRSLTPFPYLQTAALAVPALAGAGDADAMSRLLPPIAAGELTATVVWAGDQPGAGGGELSFDGSALRGTVEVALDGDVVLACVDGVLVEAEPRREPYRALDPTRPLARLRFEDAPARVLGPADGARLRDLGVAALAAEQAGGARRCLETAVAYARERVQFGRPIGSFQAIKHKLADVLLVAESARSAAYEAARAADEEDDGALRIAAAVAGAYCGEAFLRAAGENIQVHGGIGVTWEHDAHLYLKRAAADAELFGPPRAHRARLAPSVFPSMR
ncbi:acyl-CoA dehydrogenase family protein [Bailinhaonella thermotolerans]|uniref:Acyl-CoA dehydrogenase n=1 Tax=Bailinhaonella thermotolerans TaxID=1070861 RepID=A0A3A4ALP1_9ACTN|nr:acyl-CoA dehydrogenase family protein [Bailinhaonella thermotolerans]RJL26580.1 acyl-CoA dehydrogenase [Bailinhaonella thermotolerans]